MKGEELTDKEKQLFRETEELVTAARLDKIMRDHKSMAAVLDTRELFTITDVHLKTNKANRQESEARMVSRRGGRAEMDIKSKVNLAVDSFKEKGVNIHLHTGNYEMEVRIWKGKSSKPSYGEQRKFRYPELDDFFHHMTNDQRLSFKEKVGGQLIRLSEKLRVECKQLKADMDLNGIFHPEANAHRAHCTYITLLHKNIESKNIEDIVLREMYREEQKKNATEQYIQQEAAKLLREMEEKERKAAARSKLRPLTSMSNPNLLASTAAENAEKEDAIKSPSNSKKIASNKGSKKLTSTAKKDPTEAAGEKRPYSRNLPALPSSHQQRKEKVVLESPEKAFTRKLKADKRAGQDPNMLLPDEMKRLSKGETASFRRSPERSELVQEKVTSWMVNSLQRQEVSRTAAGNPSNAGNNTGNNSSNTTAPATNETATATTTNTTGKSLQHHASSAHLPTPSTTAGMSRSMAFALDEDESKDQLKLIDSIEKSTADYSPNKMLPFETFYALLKQHGGIDMDKPIPITNVSVVGGTLISKQSAYGSNRMGSMASVEAASTANANKDSANRPDSLNSNGTLSSQQQQQEAINIVKIVKEKDRGFESYLKVQDLEQPSAKLLARLNAAVARPKRQRRTAPLGRDAIELRDSRGKVSRLASKGFGNLFSAHQHPPGSLQAIQDHHEKHGEDVIYRLQREDGEVDDNSNEDAATNDDSYDQHTNASSDFSEPPSPIVGMQRNQSQRGSLKPQASFKRGRFSRSKSSFKGRSASMSNIRGSMESDAGAFFDEQNNDEVDMQHKLMAAWEALNVLATDRLTFMLKYSADEYAAEMSRAVDFWSEAATIYVMLVAVLQLRQKAEESLLLLPLSFTQVWRRLFSRLHPLLRMTADALIPPSLAMGNGESPSHLQQQPLSAAALSKARMQLRGSFQRLCQGRDEARTPQEAGLFLSEALSILGDALFKSLQRCRKELEDEIPCGHRLCRDWLMAQNVLPSSTHSNAGVASNSSGNSKV